MKDFFVTIVYGTDNFKKFHMGEPFDKEDIADKFKTYYFGTQLELDAFLMGIDEATGWLETLVFVNVEKVDDILISQET